MTAPSLDYPRGHIRPVCDHVYKHGALCDRVVTAAHVGPYGECWSNAWRYVHANPLRYAYVEGLCVVEHGSDHPEQRIYAGRYYPHAWAIRRVAVLSSAPGGYVGTITKAIECTAGWSDRGGIYRGVRIGYDDLLTAYGPTGPTESVLETRWLDEHGYPDGLPWVATHVETAELRAVLT